MGFFNGGGGGGIPIESSPTDQGAIYYDDASGELKAAPIKHGSHGGVSTMLASNAWRLSVDSASSSNVYLQANYTRFDKPFGNVTNPARELHIEDATNPQFRLSDGTYNVDFDVQNGALHLSWDGGSNWHSVDTTAV